jgi:hypothetical protein
MMPTTFLMILQEAGRAETALEGIKHPDLSKFLVISAILLIIGIAGVLTRVIWKIRAAAIRWRVRYSPFSSLWWPPPKPRLAWAS